MATEVRADMSANVWKVIAKVGETVSDTDPIVILESMKMEVPVTPESTGTIIEIAVAEGDNIKEGDLIARLDS